MKPASSKPHREGRERAPRAAPGGDAGDRKTPDTDMQPDDAGSTGAAPSAGSGPAAESVMKQTSKTGNESGSRR